RSVTVCDPAARPVKVYGEATSEKDPPSIFDSRPGTEMLKLSNVMVPVWAVQTHLRSVKGWDAVVTLFSSSASVVPAQTSILSLATVAVPPPGAVYVSVLPVWFSTHVIVWVPEKLLLVVFPTMSCRAKLPAVFLMLMPSFA